MAHGNVTNVKSEEQVVDFSAAWCGPCQVIGPVFAALSTKYPNVTFCKVDVDELQGVASSCGVKAMPTFQAYVSGQKVDELVGADRAKLEALIQGAADKAAKQGSAGPGHKLGGGSEQAAAAAGGADDSVEARRAKMAAAAEARAKAMAGGK